MAPSSRRPTVLPRRTFATTAFAALAATGLAGCGALPRSGPLASQIDPDEAAGEREGLVVPLTGAVAAEVNRATARGFPPSFLAAPAVDPTVLGVGDALEIWIWEPGGTGLFAGSDGAGRLTGVRVEPDGTVFVPFAGRIPAAGASLATVRTRVRRALEPFTSAPEVDVRLLEGTSRTLTIQGTVPQPGPYVIERANARLLPMLAFAGGATLDPARVEVAVRRDGVAGAVMLEDVYADPALDIALRPGDQLIVTALRERFFVLGASSVQAAIPFPTRELSLLGALSAAGGLRDFDANPAGVFVFRREDEALAAELLPGPPLEGLPPGPGRPVVYRLDLTAPGAIFIAETFSMRDGDAIFATNAPFTELRKVLQVFNSVLVPVQTGTTIAQ